MKKSRQERLEIYFEKLLAAEPANTYEAALGLICRTLDEVEDEFSGEPNEPDRWMELDRMFPPQVDMIQRLPGRSGVTRATTRGHHVYIGDNGSFEIWTRPLKTGNRQSTMVMSRAGADGKGLPS